MREYNTRNCVTPREITRHDYGTARTGVAHGFENISVRQSCRRTQLIVAPINRHACYPIEINLDIRKRARIFLAFTILFLSGHFRDN